MANTSFYEYLKQAFRHRVRRADDKTITPDTHFTYQGLRWNLSYKHIFEYARKMLPAVYKDLGDFPNTEEGNLKLAQKVLEKLDRHSDAELEKQFEGNVITEEHARILAEAQATSASATEMQAVESGAPPAAGSGGFGLPTPGMSPTYNPRPLMIHNIPHAEEKPDIAIANKRGVVEEPLSSKSKLVTADSSGALTGFKGETPTSKIFLANKGGVITGIHDIKSPSWLKTFGSNLQIFAGRNLDRIGRGIFKAAKTGLESANPFLGRMGTGLTNGLSTIANPGGLGGGGSRSVFGRFSRFGKKGRRTASSLAKNVKKRGLLIFLIGILGFMMLVGLLAISGTNPTGTTPPSGIPPGGGPPPTGSGCPDTSANRNDASCHYLNPSISLFYTTISQPTINSYTANYSPTFINAGKGNLSEFTNRVNYIINNSQQAGLNPAIFLGYWKSESNFSTMGSRDLGCVGDNFYEQVDCALGINKFSDPAKNPIANCAKSKDANSVACAALKSIRQTFDQTHPVNYPIATLDDFAESYGPYAHLSGGLHTNCTHTYNDLIDVAKELNTCTASSSSGGPHPVAPPIADSELRQTIIDKFGINMDANFSPTQLRWTWEKLWDISNTKFIGFIQGSFVIKVTPRLSEQVNCPGANPTIKLGDLTEEQLFKLTFVHEFGHVINNCTNTQPNYLIASNTAYIIEGGVTFYAQNAYICTGSKNESEDYAEMIAYYLNPSTDVQTASCTPPSSSKNPNLQVNFPMHYNVAKSILGDY